MESIIEKVIETVKDIELTEIKNLCDRVFDMDISTHTRKRPYVLARCVYYKICKEETESTLAAIGESISSTSRDKLDHATVLHSLKKYDENIMNFPYLYEKYLIIKQVLKGSDKGKIVNTIYDATLLKQMHQKELNSLKLEYKIKLGKINRYFKEVLALPDHEIQIIHETRIKPYLLMHKRPIRRLTKVS